MGGGAQQPQFYINFYNRNCTHKNTTSLDIVGVFFAGCFNGGDLWLFWWFDKPPTGCWFDQENVWN